MRLQFPDLGIAERGFGGDAIVEGDDADLPAAQIGVAGAGDELAVGEQVERVALGEHGKLVGLIDACGNGGAEAAYQRCGLFTAPVKVERVRAVGADAEQVERF